MGTGFRGGSRARLSGWAASAAWLIMSCGTSAGGVGSPTSTSGTASSTGLVESTDSSVSRTGNPVPSVSPNESAAMSSTRAPTVSGPTAGESSTYSQSSPTSNGSPATNSTQSETAGTAASTRPNTADQPGSSLGDTAESSLGETQDPTSEAPGASDFFPCETADPADYDVVATKEGSTWTVQKGGQEVYSGANFEQVLTASYGALTSNRTAKESILIVGDGEVSASSQLRIPSYTLVNVCGTVNVTGTPSGSDRSPFFARGASQIDIPNLKLTGSPQYGIFFRETNDIHLGRIELRLTRDAGIGIRVDSGPSAGSSTAFNRNLRIDHVYGTGMGSHIVETYGVDGIEIGAVEGEDVGECGLLLNRSINAEIGSVTCTDCATGTGYAAFRVANSVGKIGSDFPAGNIHVGKVTARGGGRGIFSVSGSGGLTIDEIDIADTGNTAILMQNTYNTVIAAQSGIVAGGVVQLTNDADNTNEGVYPPSQDVTLQNLTLTGGASVRQDWCEESGRNGCSALNITGGNVSMCP